MASAGRERAEVDPVPVEGVHPDAIAEQRPAAATAGGVDRDDTDAQLVLLVEPEPPHDLIGQRGLAGAARAGDAEHRGAGSLGRCTDRVDELGVEPAQLGAGDGAGQGATLAGPDSIGGGRPVFPEVDVAGLDHRVDHAGEAEALAVLGEKIVTPALRSRSISSGTMTPPPPP